MAIANVQEKQSELVHKGKYSSTQVDSYKSKQISPKKKPNYPN